MALHGKQERTTADIHVQERGCKCYCYFRRSEYSGFWNVKNVL